MEISERYINQAFLLKEGLFLLLIFKDKINLYNIDNKEYNGLYSTSEYKNFYDFYIIYWLKINDELFSNYRFELFQIIYDLENKPIKINFIMNYIDKEIKGCKSGSQDLFLMIINIYWFSMIIGKNVMSYAQF